MSNPAQVYEDATGLQKTAGVLAILFGLAVTIMVAYWANDSRTNLNFLGGLNWRERTFNWHPVLMVTGTMLCLVTSAVSYRILPFPKIVQKTIHALFHIAAIICLSIGLAAVINAHNYRRHNPNGTFSSNFTVVHTFVGLAVIIFYGLNFLGGIFHFVLPNVNAPLTLAYIRTHVFTGALVLMLSLAAILSGLMILTSSCGYTVTSGDWNPAENYDQLNAGCQLANGIGVVSMLVTFLCFYAIFRFHSTAPVLAAAEYK